MQRPLRDRFRTPGGAYTRRPPRQIPRVVVPSFFTLMNLFSGFLAMLQASEGQMTYACWLIVLAAFFDVLDGLMARLARADSAFGVQLDSLADVVSFGVAPSFLVYHFGLDQLRMLGVIIASLPAICGAVRLARFNVRTDGVKKDYFLGLPIPAAALSIVAFILTFDDPRWFDFLENGRFSVLVPFVIILSALMVTNVRFDSLPKPTLSALRANKRMTVLSGLALVVVLVLHDVGLFITFIGYLAYNIGRAVLRAVRALREPEPPEGAGYDPDLSQPS